MKQQRSAHEASTQPANRNSESEHSNTNVPTIPHPGSTRYGPVEPNRTSNRFLLDFTINDEIIPPSIPDEEDGMRPPSMHYTNISEDNLPVAIPVSNEQNAHTQDETIIDGVIVDPTINEPKKRRLVEWILAFATIIVLIVIIITGITTRKQSDPEQNNFNLSEFESFLKELFIPISGEEALNDESSDQYLVWKLMSTTVPTIYGEAFVFENTYEIQERYAIFVVTVGLATDQFNQATLSDSNRNPVNCKMYTCNEHNQIKIIHLKNVQNHSNGGGTIATEIGFLKGLTDIILTKNALHGTIPTQIGTLTNLQNLDLTRNKLTGSIPTEFGQLQHLELLFLDSNMFQSSIPSELGNMSETIYIGLSDNRLTGTVPTALDTLQHLKGLNVQGNDLSGSVDNLCDRDDIPMNGSISKTLTSERLHGAVSGLKSTHKYVGEYGIEVDCVDNGTMPVCSCCNCGN